MLNLLDDFAHFLEIFLMIFAFYMGFKLGSGTMTEVYHYYKQDSEVEIPTNDDGKPVYNTSVPDPEYAEWYHKNK